MKDRTPEELENFRRTSMIGDRPTWPMGQSQAGIRFDGEWTVDDPLDILGLHPDIPNPFESAEKRQRKARLTPKQKQALDKLGLDESASVDDIKKRFKSLVKRYHPDSNGGRGTEDRLKQIIQAYSDLKESGHLAAQEA